MKKILPYIFILTIIVQFFAPFSVETNETNKRLIVSLENNIALAEEDIKFQYINIETTLVEGAEEIDLVVKVSGDTSIAFSSWATIFSYDYYLETTLLDKDKKTIDGYNPKTEFFKVKDQDAKTYSFKFKNLTKNTDYFLQIKFGIYETTGVGGTFKSQKTQKKETIVVPAKTKNEGEEVTQTNLEEISDTNEINTSTDGPDDTFNCHIIDNPRGCIADIAYTVLFKPAAFLFGLTGRAMDLTLKYSLEDTSYRSVFVVEGWGIVRDICNIFFIFVLLFIAFKVILGLGGKGDPKGMIVNVIVVGLLINFSLFATRIIIDASNILSRVFYNAETINIKSNGESLGSLGEIKFSEALVQKINPVTLITNSNKVGDLSGAMQEAEDEQQIGSRDVKKVSDAIPIGLGTFIIVCILCAALCIVGIVVFLNLTIVFIARVVMLWLAMILSPFAFFSYTVPKLEGLPFVVFKNWLNETTKMAFVAPVFCFFLYIIISFLDNGLGLIDVGQNATGFDFVLGIFVPFLFLAALLMQTKKIAITMSGQAGKFVAEIGSKVAGTTVGLASGGAAMAMRGTIGAIGAKMASSERWSKMEEKGGFQGFIGRNMRNAGLSLGSKSYDVRNTNVGQKTAGLLDIGKTVKDPLASRSKPGSGIIGNREDKLKKVEEREAKFSKLRPKTDSEKKVDELVEKQVKLKNKNATRISEAEKERDDAKEKQEGKQANYNIAKENLRNKEKAYNRVKGTAGEEKALKELEEAQKENDAMLKELNEAKKEYDEAKKKVSTINNGGSISIKNEKGEISHTLPNAYDTDNGNITEKLYETAKKDYDEAKRNVTEKEINFESLEKNKESEIQRIEKDKEVQISNLNKEIDGLLSKEKDKRRKTIKKTENFYDGEIGKARAELSTATKSNNAQKVAELTEKITELNKNKVAEVSKATIEANKTYGQAKNQILKDKRDSIRQMENKARGEIKSIGDNLEKAQKEYGEAKARGLETEEIMETAEKAKEYAEQHGGFGKSSSQLKKEVAELNVEIGKEKEERIIGAAERLGSKNIFNRSETIELTGKQKKEKRVKIFDTLKDKK